MKLFINFALIILLVAFASGCMHTYKGHAGVESPDSKFKIVVKSHGKSAHAYVDYTVKKVVMSILEEPKSSTPAVYQKWAVLYAADLDWKTSWSDSSTVRIDFYDKLEQSEEIINRGFIIIGKENINSPFHVIDHSHNIELKDHIYFF